MDNVIFEALAPTGVLRAGINMSNFLLVSGTLPDGTPDGISPDIARRIAKELGVECNFVLFDRPGDLADAVDANIWDIGNIAFEAARAHTIDFSIPYVQIDANFLVHKDSRFTRNDDIDTDGTKIAVAERSAYDLWLSDHFTNAEIIRTTSIPESHNIFRRGETDILASLKPKLLEELNASDLYKLIEPPFTSIQQSVGIRKGHKVARDFLNNLISDLILNGFITGLLKKHRVDQKLSIPDTAKQKSQNKTD